MKKRIVFLFIIFFSFINLIQAQTCPTITLHSPFDINQGDTVYFSANVSGLKDGVNVTYNWTVSSGYIMSGQGTYYIKVNSNCLGGQHMTATVEIGGLPPECARTSSASTSINGSPAETKLHTNVNYTTLFYFTADATKFASDFSSAYNVLQPSRVVVFLYPGNNSTIDPELTTMTTYLKTAFKSKDIKPSLYKIVIGGKRLKQSYEMWIVPECGIEPAATPAEKELHSNGFYATSKYTTTRFTEKANKFAVDFTSDSFAFRVPRALIYIYPGNNATAENDITEMTAIIRSAFAKYNMKSAMYKIITGGKREKSLTSYEMWIVSEGGIDPEATPKAQSIIFEEHFETETGKWKGREGYQGVVINKVGKLQVTSLNKLTPVFIDFPTCILPENFSIEITTRWKAKQTDLFYGYGLGWDPFRFHIYNNGDRRAIYYDYIKNDWGVSLTWGGVHSFIKTGVDAENKIKIVCYKDQAEYFINGTLAGKFPVHFKNRILQLMVEGEQTVWFDDIIVTSLAPK